MASRTHLINPMATVAAVCDRRFPPLFSRRTALMERRYIYEMASSPFPNRRRDWKQPASTPLNPKTTYSLIHLSATTDT